MGKLERTDNPRDLGLDPKRLQRAYRLFDQWTESGEPPMPGAALLVGRGDQYLSPRFFGRMGPEPDAVPLRHDGIFLTASITKPVVYLAAMQLVEEGRLALSDRVVRYISDFGSHHKDETRIIHLMTHTSGLPDMLPHDIELRKKHSSLDQFLKGAIGSVPLFPPGTDCRYQSMGTLVTAAIVEQLTREKIRDYLKNQIFAPLGMRHTALGCDGLDVSRLVRVETRYGPESADWDWNSNYWQQLGAPWGGLFTTPEDFALLCHSILDDVGDRSRILSRSGLLAMRTNQLPMLRGMSDTVIRSQRWGLGWKLNTPDGSSDEFGDLLGLDVFGHTGATGTMVWLDPQTRLFCIQFTTGVRSKAPWRQVVISNIIAASLEK